MPFWIHPLIFFLFQSIFLTQKYLDRSIPRILMPVQVIWRMELLVHHEESNWSSWKLYHLLTFLLILDEEFRAPPQNQALVRLWHSHYHCNHKGGSTLDKLKEACAINAETERRQPCLGVPLAALLTTFSIVPWLCGLVEFYVARWWLSLWSYLIRFFIMIVGVLWVFYLQWHQLSSWVPPFVPPTSLLSTVFLPDPLCMLEGETESNTNVNKQKLPSPPPSR